MKLNLIIVGLLALALGGCSSTIGQTWNGFSQCEQIGITTGAGAGAIIGLSGGPVGVAAGAVIGGVAGDGVCKLAGK